MHYVLWKHDKTDVILCRRYVRLTVPLLNCLQHYELWADLFALTRQLMRLRGVGRCRARDL
jgi:hypothetical protein